MQQLLLQERGTAPSVGTVPGKGAVQCEEVQHCDGCSVTRVPVPAITHPRGKRWPGRAR